MLVPMIDIYVPNGFIRKTHAFVKLANCATLFYWIQLFNEYKAELESKCLNGYTTCEVIGVVI